MAARAPTITTSRTIPTWRAKILDASGRRGLGRKWVLRATGRHLRAERCDTEPGRPDHNDQNDRRDRNDRFDRKARRGPAPRRPSPATGPQWHRSALDREPTRGVHDDVAADHPPRKTRPG